MKIVNCELKICRGFTLVELLVSVSILLLVLGAAVSVEVQSIKLADTNQHSLQATNLAQQQLNLVKTVRDNNPANDPFVGFSSVVQRLKDNGASPWGIEDGNRTKTVETNGVTYTIEIKASDACNLGEPGCGP